MSAIAYHDAITKVLDDIRRTQIGKIQQAGEAVAELDRLLRPRLALREWPLRHPGDGRVPPLRQLRGLRPPLRPAPHVVERGGAGRGAGAALDRAAGGLRPRLPPELRPEARRLLRRVLARRPQRGADRGCPLREGAGADRDHRVLARQRRGGEGDPLVRARSSPTSPTSRSTTASRPRTPRWTSGGRRRSPRARRWPSSTWRWRSSPRQEPGSWRRATSRPPSCPRTSPGWPPGTTCVSSRPTRGGSRSVERREHALGLQNGAAPGRGLRRHVPLRHRGRAPGGDAPPPLGEAPDRPRAGGRALPRHERLHAGLELRPRRPAGPLRHEATARGGAPGGRGRPAGRGRGGELRPPADRGGAPRRRRQRAQRREQRARGGPPRGPGRQGRGPQPRGSLLRLRRALHPLRDRTPAASRRPRGDPRGRCGPVRTRRGGERPARLPSGQAGGRPVARRGCPARAGPAGSPAGAPAVLPVRQRVHRRAATRRPSSPATSA